jgi:iron complex transport system permease protein
LIFGWRRRLPTSDQRKLAIGASLLLVVWVLGMVASLALGAVSVPWREVADALLSSEHPRHVLIYEIRLARALACTVVGAAFAVAGALLQTIVRNPLADTGLLGVNAGAGLAVVAALILMPERGTALPWIAFGGALAAVLILASVAWGLGGQAGPLKILLSGVAVQAVLYAAIAVLSFLFADRTPAFIAFTVGSLQGATWGTLLPALPLVAVGLAVACAAHRPLDLLLLDDASAGSAGLAVGGARLFAAFLSALLAAAAVALAGLVGFVGLLVPNTVRLLTGPDHRRLLPLSAMGGACLVLYADLAARYLWVPVELPVGAIMALVGGPYFLVVLWKRLP